MEATRKLLFHCCHIFFVILFFSCLDATYFFKKRLTFLNFNQMFLSDSKRRILKLFFAVSDISRLFFASNPLKYASVSFDIRSLITQSVKKLQLRISRSTCCYISKNKHIDYAYFKNFRLNINLLVANKILCNSNVHCCTLLQSEFISMGFFFS